MKTRKTKLVGLVFLSGFLILIPILVGTGWIPNNFLFTNKDKTNLFSKKIMTQRESYTTDKSENNDLPLTDSNDGLTDGNRSDPYKDWFKQPEYEVIYLD
ncbi:MAG: hypothetical protein LBQ15_01090 [Clostridium sp.]|jgi:hypothetical protein|nr:hypothetical protein [Clostridium sp.]